MKIRFKFIFFLISLFLCFLITSFKEKDKTGLREGEMAPEIALPTPKGDTLRLSSLRGHMVLVHFWASWCEPCRHDSRDLVQLYEKYRDKEFNSGQGFIVLYVSLDESKTEWEKAIKEDGLDPKYNVSDLKRWKSSAVQEYRVGFVPDNFLIDGNGKILVMGNIIHTLRNFISAEVKGKFF